MACKTTGCGQQNPSYWGWGPHANGRALKSKLGGGETENGEKYRVKFKVWKPEENVRDVQWIGLGEDLQERPIFNGKIYGCLLIFP